MSTVPAPALFDTAIDGPILDRAPLERGLAVAIDELVAAKRDLQRIRAERDRAARLLADVDGTLSRAAGRVMDAEKALAAYVNARVEGPIP